MVWTLGGRNSTYKLGSGVEFAFQHDARLHTDSDPTVTIFDDGGGPPRTHTESRAITVHLDSKTKTATLQTEDLHSPALAASFEGNVQELPGGDDFVGWGQQPYFSEFNSNGQVDFDGRFVGNNSSYRAYRFPWAGTPTTLPSVSASSTGTSTNVYVSWNGATQVQLVARAGRCHRDLAVGGDDRGQAGVREPGDDPGQALRRGSGARQRRPRARDFFRRARRGW